MVPEEDWDAWWKLKKKQTKHFQYFFVWENRHFIYNMSDKTWDSLSSVQTVNCGTGF